MKILFLDFDGVLNTDAYQDHLRTQGKPGWDDYGQLFDPAAVANLKRILDAVPGVQLVVHSSWKAQGLDELRLMWKERSLPCELFDVTPDIFCEDILTMDLSDPDSVRMLEGNSKGAEIRAWLDRKADEDFSYVILDDMAEFDGSLAAHHVKTGAQQGLTEEDAERAISILHDCLASFQL